MREFGFRVGQLLELTLGIIRKHEYPKKSSFRPSQDADYRFLAKYTYAMILLLILILIATVIKMPLLAP